MSEGFDRLRLRALTALDGLWPVPIVDDVNSVNNVATVAGLAPGVQVLGRYTLEAVLGEGGFGRVWQALDATTSKHVALKELKASAKDDSGLLLDQQSGMQLEQEFFSLSRLRHKNIVAVIDYGELPQAQGGARFLVMELVPGKDVHDRLKSGPLPRDEALRVLLGLAQGLQLLHTRLYVHGDIKAENVRVVDDGSVKLMDFGLLHQLGTAAQQIQGTVEYMAPEVIKGSVIDGRTDLYALGVLAYEMFTGSVPFAEGTPFQMMQQHLTATPRAPSHFLDLPAEIDALVLQLLEKDPQKRPKSAAVVAERVAAIAGIDVGADAGAQRTSYLYSARLIGRDDDAKVVDDVRANAKAGEFSAVFVAGRAGEGKTRLLDELRLKVKLDRMVWASGQCRKEGLEPLAPLVEALSVLVARTPDDVLAPHGAVLSHVLPRVRERGFTPPPFSNPTQAQFKVNAAAAAWLTTLAVTTPFVLCIEDLHAADGATLDLLNHLVRSLHGKVAAGVVGTFRSDEVDRAHRVYNTVDEQKARLLTLRGLSRADVDAVLASTLSEHQLPDAFVDDVFGTSAGNAFFLIEMLRWLVEVGAVKDEAGAFALSSSPPALPASLSAVMTMRLAALPPSLLSLAQSLAPAGRALDVKLVEALGGGASTSLYEQIEQLVERQVLQRGGARLFFANDVVRAAIVDGTDAAVRGRQHQKIGALLEQGVLGPVAPSVLAHHFGKAVDDVARDHGVDLYLQAAKQAMAKQQLLEATQLAGEGAALLAASKRADKAALDVAFQDLMATTSVATHPPTTVKAVEHLLQTWKHIDPDRVLAEHEAKKQQWAKLPKLLQSALAPWHPSPPPKMPAPSSGRGAGPPPPFDPSTTDPLKIVDRLQTLLGMEAMALASLGEPERAIDVADTMIRRTRQAMGAAPGPPSPLVAVGSVPKLLALVHMGRLSELRVVGASTTAVFDKVGDHLPPPLRAFWFLSHYLMAFGEAVGGTTAFGPSCEKALAVATRFDLPQEKTLAQLPRLVAAAVRGVPDEVSKLNAELEDMCWRLGFPYILNSRMRLWLPTFHLERGELAQARAITNKLEGMGKATRDSWLLTYAALYRGLDAQAAGNDVAAEPLLRQSVETARQKKLGRLTVALCALGEVLVALGKRDEALTLADEALARATTSAFACPYDEVISRRLRARVADDNAGAGNDAGNDAARAHLDRSVSLAHEIENPVQEGFSLVARARFCAAHDDVVGARSDADRARAVFGSIANDRGRKDVDAVVGGLA